MKDIIEETQKDYKNIILKESIGTVNNRSFSLRLVFKEKYLHSHWVDVYEMNTNLEMECFSTRFFANRYYNKLVRKYNLIEEKPKVKS